MKEHSKVTSEKIRQGLLNFTSNGKLDEVISPMMQEYWKQVAQEPPKVFDKVLTFGVSPHQKNEIEQIHVPELMTKFLAIGLSLMQRVKEKDLNKKGYVNVSRNMCLIYEKMVILEVAKRLPTAGIDLDALFKVTKDSFNEKFKDVLFDIPDKEHKNIFAMAYNQDMSLIHPTQ